MKEAIVFFLLLTSLVGVLVWIYYEYISISDTLARGIETAGYALLIVIAIWGFGVKNIALNDFYNDDWFYFNEKLEYIFRGITKISEGQHFDTVQAWDGFQAAKSSDFVETQLLAVDIAEAVLQISSVGCIAVGRLQELKNTKKKKSISARKENQPQKKNSKRKRKSH